MAREKFTLTPQELDRFKAHLARFSTTEDGCWPWDALCFRGGYGIFTICRTVNGAGRSINLGAHRVAWEAVAGPIPDGYQALHTCDNRPCTRNDDSGVYVLDGIEHERHGHLWLGTATDNAKDRHIKQREARGEKHGTHTHPESLLHGEAQPRSKLSNAEILAIRECIFHGMSQRAVAQRFGVAKATIYGIVHGKTWSHVL